MKTIGKAFLWAMTVCLIFAIGLLFGMETSMQPQRGPQELKLNIRSDTPTRIETGDRVSKTMAVKNPEGELSIISFVAGDTGYMKLWGGITGYDSTSVWNDLLLFEKVYKVKDISIYISSGGGAAFSGLALADEIERISKKIPVTMYASGIVASAAVPVYSVGTKRIATRGTIFMVHPATMGKWLAEEGEKDLDTQKAMFQLLKSKYIEKLVNHSKSSSAEWTKREEQTTWFDAFQGQKWGLVDEIQ